MTIQQRLVATKPYLTCTNRILMQKQNSVKLLDAFPAEPGCELVNSIADFFDQIIIANTVGQVDLFNHKKIYHNSNSNYRVNPNKLYHYVFLLPLAVSIQREKLLTFIGLHSNNITFFAHLWMRVHPTIST